MGRGNGHIDLSFVRESFMLGKRASVASAFVLCVLSINFQPQSASAGETQSASVLVVPVPVPAVARGRQRCRLLPLRLHPRSTRSRTWPASGRARARWCLRPGATSSSAASLPIEVADEASRVRQHLRCQGENRNFDAVTRMDIVDDRVTGVWADNVYSIGGTLHGKVTGKGFIVQLRSTFFDARLSVVSSDCQQTVKLVPDDPAAS